MTWKPLTEDQIERGTERATDDIDAAYMCGLLNDWEYEKAISDINDWAEAKYDILRRLDR